jgi:hypothetical protein
MRGPYEPRRRVRRIPVDPRQRWPGSGHQLRDEQFGIERRLGDLGDSKQLWIGR